MAQYLVLSSPRPFLFLLTRLDRGVSPLKVSAPCAGSGSPQAFDGSNFFLRRLSRTRVRWLDVITSRVRSAALLESTCLTI